MNIHQTTHAHGDIVYLKTDQEQRPRMVLCIHIWPTGVMYELGCGPDSSDHHEFEITATVDETVRLGLKEVEK